MDGFEGKITAEASHAVLGGEGLSVAPYPSGRGNKTQQMQPGCHGCCHTKLRLRVGADAAHQ